MTLLTFTFTHWHAPKVRKYPSWADYDYARAYAYTYAYARANTNTNAYLGSYNIACNNGGTQR
jgi:hypothetical protein